MKVMCEHNVQVKGSKGNKMQLFTALPFPSNFPQSFYLGTTTFQLLVVSFPMLYIFE